MPGVKGKSGRKPLAKEIQYLEAVKAGAPVAKVKKAVASVLARAEKEGDPRALSAVLQYIVPALNRSESGGIGETQKYIDEVRNALGLGAESTEDELVEDKLSTESDTGKDLQERGADSSD